ncbi:integral membrane protein [Apodospora peruviana]|uniref:Integral membrane protein n=1 Tax=Apodospora peruviana TaxID=516989 RepID=A0AAE0I0Y5_9PEZI|nr:integral membrane protein [Apodospora peruviana]
MTTTEPARTKFNLTYPPLPFNGTADEIDPSAAGMISGILFGILVPHIICTLIVLARTSSRLFLLRKWFLDDTLIALAWLFSTAVCIVYSIAASSPTTMYTTVTGGAVRPYVLRTYVGLICYQLCLCLTKLSVLAFYFRMFSSRPLERRLAWATVIFVLLYGVPLLFMTVFQCHPIPGQFFGVPMKCFTFVPLLITSASLHSATDAWLIVLIIPCIVRLDLPPRQKAALAVVLSLGIFVIAASLTRLQLSLKANYRPSSSSGLAAQLAFFVMTVLELDLAIMCASAPTLRPVLARFWPRFMSGDIVQQGEQYQQQQRQRRRQRHSRWLVGRRPTATTGTSGSVDLTSVVSYHGYPWTQPATPARSKNPSMADLGDKRSEVPMPTRPLPAAYHRTPTTLSLRSFMSSIVTATPGSRSRGQTLTGGGGEDRAGLLQLEDKDGDVNPEVLEKRRRSSIGFEGYYDQYFGYGEMMETAGKRRSRTLMRIETSRPGSASWARRSGGRWGDSQESFVLGVNDPNSPTRPRRASGATGIGVAVNRLSPVLSDAGGTSSPVVDGVTPTEKKEDDDKKMDLPKQ